MKLYDILQPTVLACTAVKRASVFIGSGASSKFTAIQLQHLVILGLDTEGQKVKGSFTAFPELTLFAFSNCHTVKLLFLTCNSKELIYKQWWIQRVTAGATNLTHYFL